MEHNFLDIGLFVAMVLLWIGTFIFRRFQEFEYKYQQKQVHISMWGAYATTGNTTRPRR